MMFQLKRRRLRIYETKTDCLDGMIKKPLYTKSDSRSRSSFQQKILKQVQDDGEGFGMTEVGTRSRPTSHVILNLFQDLLQFGFFSLNGYILIFFVTRVTPRLAGIPDIPKGIGFLNQFRYISQSSTFSSSKQKHPLFLRRLILYLRQLFLRYNL